MNNHWGGTLEINGGDSTNEDEKSRNNLDWDRASISHQGYNHGHLDETQQSWLLGPSDKKKKKKYVDLGCIVCSRDALKWTLGSILVAFFVIGLPIIIAKSLPRHKHRPSPPDNYTVALHKALLFFNAQKSGKLPKNNGIPWRGDSGLQDGSDQTDLKGGLVGGYYDAGDNTKFHFPMSFAMTMLSWSVIEYEHKYRAIGEYDHVRDLIKWGTDYLLLTFNSSATKIDKIYSQLPAADAAIDEDKAVLSPGYPYEDMLRSYHNVTGLTMCSYLKRYNVFNWTRGGMIELNHGRAQNLQYVANAAFLASVFADYLNATGVPGWNCGPNFFPISVLKDFATSQMNYILGSNPLNMSYVVGHGPKFPRHVHHRGASIPKDRTKYSCAGGWRWRDAKTPNPNTIAGAMVGGPDHFDKFKDVRTNYSYTEPTVAGNAGLVAALVSLTSSGGVGIDKNTIFSAVPPLYPTSPPPPPPWKP
ncbi:hypothetical protein DH2020_029903 [Rehmannia glutinosa]|uniref:Endoglucanase n=1 Tax=Rehmannia glutinosa TaxID=99300 RepID=A0ABR0VQQ4_REHGL